MFQLMVLHWGEVQQSITVSGADPASGVTKKIKRGGKTSTSSGSGKTKRVSGSGGGRSVGGGS